MSERRKRTVRVSGDSEEFSEGSEDVEPVKASEGESEHDAEVGVPRGESEYESADSEEDDQGSVEKRRGGGGGGERDASSDVNEEDEELVEDEEEEELMYEREEGDGQESTTPKKLDDDEDRRNPQYIPKRGTFYEHDDRTAEDQEEETKKEEPRKKKVWRENDDCWSHDKFNEADQAPKSRDELVASYGYDIRSEEGPPRARRRRRYGRGPNKYDRNWEDENAYSKPTRGGGSGRGGLRKSTEGLNRGSKQSDINEIEVQDEEEFPALSSAPPRRGAPRGRGGRGRTTREFESSHRQQIRNQKATESVAPPHAPPPQVFTSPTSTPPAPTNQPSRVGRGKPVRTGGSGRFVENRGKPRKPAPNERRSFPGPREEHYTENHRDETHLEADMRNLSMKEGEPVVSRDFRRQPSNKSSTSTSYHQSGERRQANVPPRLQQDAAANRPKRYSSQRQRSLPETAASYEQPGGYYEQQGYQQHAVYADTAQPPPPQPAAVPVTSAQPQANSPQILPPPGPAFAPSFPSPPPPTFISHVQASPQPTRMYPPAQPTPTFIAAPSGSMINYVPTPPAQFTATYPTFQSFPPVPQPPPPQPTEMFVPSSGITYYSPQNQLPRHTPLKRPKAAIPILPPPPKEQRGSTPRQESPPSTSSKQEPVAVEVKAEPTVQQKEVVIEAPREQVIEATENVSSITSKASEVMEITQKPEEKADISHNVNTNEVKLSSSNNEDVKKEDSSDPVIPAEVSA